MNQTKWLTVDEASLLCREMGLNRSKKTMRRWAQHGEVEAKKQTMQKTMRWLISEASLETKIQEELEFLEQQQAASTQAAPIAGQGSDTSAYDRTRADLGAYEHPKADNERTQPDMAELDKIRSLKTQVQTLSVDVGWRDKMLDKLTRENEVMQENMHGQARYIGHLESDLMRLGGEPDQTFLAAPTVKKAGAGAVGTAVINEPHPDQQNLYTG